MWLGSGLTVAAVEAAAAAPIQPLAWKLPYAAGVALKKKKKDSIRKREETILIIGQPLTVNL